MKQLQKMLLYVLVVTFSVVAPAFAQSQPPLSPEKNDDIKEQSLLVGRIAHIQGTLLRYVREEKDWVATVADGPFGMEDALYSDDKGKAEFIMPNETWIRIGGNTQIQMIRLVSDLTETDLASGIARFYNKSSNAAFKVSSPFGYVVAPAQSIFDLYVGDQSIEVVSIKGNVDFVHVAGDTRYEVVAGEASILADATQVGSGEATVDEAWDAWNLERDSLWSKRVEVRGDSVRYLPEQIQDQSYVLEEQGRWQRVYYENEYRHLWQPSQVEPDWVPYSQGRWVDYYEDPCWIPDPSEHFGYVTHHYGSWVHVNTGWFWAPPLPVAPPPLPAGGVGMAAAPLLGIGFGWWPGRVGWIYSDANIGWFPLGWREPWYGHRPWGPGAIVYSAAAPPPPININTYAYAGHAVVVSRNNLFTTPNYRTVQVPNINRQVIVGNYQAAPVLNNRIIPNYSANPNRFMYANIPVAVRPHSSVLNRIQMNSQLVDRDRGLGAAGLIRNVGQMRIAPLAPIVGVKPPSLTSKLVPGGDVHRPLVDMRPGMSVLKARGIRPMSGAAVGALPGGPKTPPGPGGRPGQPSPAGVGGPIGIGAQPGAGPKTLVGPRGAGGQLGPGGAGGPAGIPGQTGVAGQPPGPKTPHGAGGRGGTAAGPPSGAPAATGSHPGTGPGFQGGGVKKSPVSPGGPPSGGIGTIDPTGGGGPRFQGGGVEKIPAGMGGPPAVGSGPVGPAGGGGPKLQRGGVKKSPVGPGGLPSGGTGPVGPVGGGGPKFQGGGVKQSPGGPGGPPSGGTGITGPTSGTGPAFQGGAVRKSPRGPGGPSSGGTAPVSPAGRGGPKLQGGGTRTFHGGPGGVPSGVGRTPAAQPRSTTQPSRGQPPQRGKLPPVPGQPQ